MDTAVIMLQADFNHLGAEGRLRLGDLRMHQQTPFAQIAAKHESILFVDGEDVVRGELIHDPRDGWIAKVDCRRRTSGKPIHLPSPPADQRHTATVIRSPLTPRRHTVRSFEIRHRAL